MVPVAAAGANVPYKIVDRRPGDTVAVWAATEYAEQELGWKSKLGLTEMCRDQWAWAKKYPKVCAQRASCLRLVPEAQLCPALVELSDTAAGRWQAASISHMTSKQSHRLRQGDSEEESYCVQLSSGLVCVC